jgi:hypothetical protein
MYLFFPSISGHIAFGRQNRSKKKPKSEYSTPMSNLSSFMAKKVEKQN